jgi:hypothetical protein
MHANACVTTTPTDMWLYSHSLQAEHRGQPGCSNAAVVMGADSPHKGVLKLCLFPQLISPCVLELGKACIERSNLIWRADEAVQQRRMQQLVDTCRPQHSTGGEQGKSCGHIITRAWSFV